MNEMILEKEDKKRGAFLLLFLEINSYYSSLTTQALPVQSSNYKPYKPNKKLAINIKIILSSLLS